MPAPVSDVSIDTAPPLVVDAVPLMAEPKEPRVGAFLAGLSGWTLDAFDFFLVVLSLTTIGREFGQSDKHMTLALTATLALRPVGAFFFGGVADRFGRKIPLVINLCLFAVVELSTAFARTFTEFLIIRAVFGVVMGGQWGVGVSLAMEKVPARYRGVLSGGYGIFYDRLSNQLGLLESLSVPNYESATSTNTAKNSTFDLTSSLANPFPVLPQRSQFPILPQIYSPTAANAPAPLGINDVDPQLRTPYYEQYGLQLQTAFTHTLSLEVGYVGSGGHRLPVETEINQARIASAASPVNGVTTNNTGTNDTTLIRAPYQGFSNTGLLFLQTNTSSNFNSLQTTVLQRMKSAQLTVSYMWSKSLDTNSGSTDGSVFTNLSGDQTNTSQAYGVSDFDRPHHLTGRLSEPIALPKRWTWAHRGAGARVFGGYELDAIGVIQSGIPINVTYAAAATYYGTDQSRASYAPNVNLHAIAGSGATENRLTQYFNTAAFVSPGTGFGNVARNTLRGPLARDLDLSMTKITKIHDNVNAEFRAQAFNLTNTPNFANPTSDAGNAAFGVIANTVGNPRLLQFVLKVNF